MSVLPLAPVVPNTVTVIEVIIQDKGTWYAATDIKNALFSIPLHGQDLFAAYKMGFFTNILPQTS